MAELMVKGSLTKPVVTWRPLDVTMTGIGGAHQQQGKHVKLSLEAMS